MERQPAGRASGSGAAGIGTAVDVAHHLAARRLRRRRHRYHRRPLIALTATGGRRRAQLVASSDLAVCGESARFATPGVSIGLFCTTPGVALARTVPHKAALKLLLTGDPISAREALAIGLVNEVVPDGDGVALAAEALAARIARASRATVAVGKRAFYRQIGDSRGAAYRFAEGVMRDNMKMPDAREGIAAFLEKRTPTWTHAQCAAQSVASTTAPAAPE